MAAARSESDIVVGVHIRQDDLRTVDAPSYFLFETPEYASFMRKLLGLFPGKRVGFIVCSDEKQDYTNFVGLAVSPGPGSVVGDMYTLAACDYILCSPSSFSTWASFWGGVPLCRITSKNQTLSLDDFLVREPTYD